MNIYVVHKVYYNGVSYIADTLSSKAKAIKSLDKMVSDHIRDGFTGEFRSDKYLVEHYNGVGEIVQLKDPNGVTRNNMTFWIQKVKVN